MLNDSYVAMESHIPAWVQGQRDFFHTGQTRPMGFRLDCLKRLKGVVARRLDAIHEALHADLGKSAPEAYVTETGIVLKELGEAISKAPRWAQPRKVGTPLFHVPARSRIHPEPYGNVLIIAPWNYPFLLMFSPLIGAVAAGNTVFCKPSECAPHTSAIIREILTEAFEANHVRVLEGGVLVSTALLRERWDYIFFTGSTHVGRMVYQAAARHLTPVTLELGGKSPCIVDKDIHLEHTARRIAWGKFLNVGQTCIAPDYLLVHEEVKEALLARIQEKIQQFYGTNPKASEDYGHIINERHFERLLGLIDRSKVVFGGDSDKEALYISPTIMDGVGWDDPVMQEEIFGPILPVMTWTNLDEALAQVNAQEKPLALYAFSNKASITQKIIEQCPSGGASVNDTILHIANQHLPFGGVGESGIGAYHGISTFDTFSHLKSVLHKSPYMDLDIRYAPWGVNFKKLKQLMRWFL